MKLRTQISLAVSSAFFVATALASQIPAVPSVPTFIVNNMNGEAPAQGQYGTQLHPELTDGLQAEETAVVYSGWKNSGGTSPSLLTATSAGMTLTNHGKIWVLAGGEYGNYAEGMGNFVNAESTLINEGTIYVKSEAWFEGAKAMGANAGATIINQGTIVVEGGVGMYANSGANGEMINENRIEVYSSTTEGVYSVGMSWNKANAELKTFKNQGEIVVTGENTFGVWAESIKNGATFENAGLIEATDGGTAITASQAKDFTLALTGNSHIVGDVVLADSANITATGLTSSTETLQLKNSQLNSLSLKDSSLGFTGEGLLHIGTVTFEGDKGSKLILKDTRSLEADTVNGTVVVESDHLAESGEKLITINNVADEGSVSVSFTNAVTDTLSNADAAKTIADTQISIGSDGNGEKTVTFAEGSVLGEITVDANGKVTEKANSSLDAYRSVHALSAISWRNEMNDLTKRMGELRNSPAAVGTWVRLYGSEQEYGAQSVTSKNTSIQVGADYDVGANWKVGAAFTYTDGTSTYDNGNADVDAYGFALYGSWFADNGQFVDLIAKYNRMSTDFTLGAMDGSYDNNAWSVSAEYGWHFKMSDLTFIEPQIELTYGQILGDDFAAANGVTIKQDDFDSLIGRVGVRGGFYFPNNKGTIYLRGSVLHDFQGEMESNASNGTANKSFYDDLGGTWYEVGVGANFNLTDRTYTYVDLEKNAGGEVKENWRWNVGLRHVW